LTVAIKASTPEDYFSVTIKKEVEAEQATRDTMNYKSALTLAKNEGVSEEDITKTTNNTGATNRAKFHALLKLIKQTRNKKIEHTKKMKFKYSMMALTAFSMAEDASIPRDEVFAKESKIKEK
jgi:hypothetical protein